MDCKLASGRMQALGPAAPDTATSSESAPAQSGDSGDCVPTQLEAFTQVLRSERQQRHQAEMTLLDSHHRLAVINEASTIEVSRQQIEELQMKVQCLEAERDDHWVSGPQLDQLNNLHEVHNDLAEMAARLKAAQQENAQIRAQMQVRCCPVLPGSVECSMRPARSMRGACQGLQSCVSSIHRQTCGCCVGVRFYSFDAARSLQAHRTLLRACA